MGPPDLDDVAPRLRLGIDCIVQGSDRRNQALLHVDCRRNVHRRREGVVGRLRHVDMIVGVNRRLAPERRPRNLAAPIGDHFVDVHVELGAAARHPNMQREHVMMLSGEDFIANLHDQLVTLIVEPLAGVIRRSGGLLQGGIGGDHFAWNEISADAEVLERALGLSAPQLVRRYFNHPEAVLFRSHVDHGTSPEFSSASARLDQTPDQQASRIVGDDTPPTWSTSSAILAANATIRSSPVSRKFRRHIAPALDPSWIRNAPSGVGGA